MASAPLFAEVEASGVLSSEREYRRDIEGISGYLITLIIVGEMAKRHFSLAEFYRRRVVRIFPALFAMLAIILAVGCAVMLPLELEELGRSAAASVGFVSNIFFWLEADYFAPPAETIPLLHT